MTIKKACLSVSISRALAVDYPVGDPFGGPAYGKREMPAAAVVAAVVEGSAIVEAGGLAAMAASAGVMSTVAAVGAVMAGVGVITGNESLTKIGGVMGITAGIANFASSKGWVDLGSLGKPAAESGLAATTGNTESLINSGTAGVTQTASPVTEVATAAGNDVTGSALANAEAGSSGSIGESLAQTSGTSGESIMTNSGQGSGLINSSGSPWSAYSSGAADQAASGVDKLFDSLPSTANGEFTGLASAAAPGNYAASLGGGASSADSIFDNLKNIGSFMKDNKEVSAAALYGVSKFFETTSDLSQAKTKEAQAMADLYANRAAVEQQQVANANYVPNVSNQFALKPAGTTPFKTTTPTYRAPNVGLINSKV